MSLSYIKSDEDMDPVSFRKLMDQVRLSYTTESIYLKGVKKMSSPLSHEVFAVRSVDDLVVRYYDANGASIVPSDATVVPLIELRPERPQGALVAAFNAAYAPAPRGPAGAGGWVMSGASDSDPLHSNLAQPPEEAAAKLGLQVLLPGPRDLFLDLDTAEALVQMHQMIACLESNDVGVEVLHVGPSKSGLPRRHAYLQVDRELSPLERLLLQACLGSDCKRELLGLLRVWLHPERAPSTFFEKPEFVDPRLPKVPLLLEGPCSGS